MDAVTHMLAYHPHLAGLAIVGPYAVGGVVGVVGLLVAAIFGGCDAG